MSFAVQMATIAKRRGSGAIVKTLTDNIVRTQTTEISTMRTADQRLENAGVKKGSLGVPGHDGHGRRRRQPEHRQAV